MDINKLLNDVSNVFNDNTKNKKKKLNDEFTDGLSYLNNKSKKIKHLENRINMPNRREMPNRIYMPQRR